MVLGKTLESPLYCLSSNQFILKEVSPEHSLEGLMLKLKFQYFGQLMQRADSFEKTVMLVKIEGRKKRGCQRMNSILNSMNMSLSKLQGIVKCAAVHGVAKSWTQLNDFTFNFHFHALEKEMATHHAPPSLGFSRQEYWGGVPFPSP